MSGSSRWLEPDQQRAWRTVIVALNHVSERIERQLVRDAGMPHAYYMILVRLSEAEGNALPMSVLARALQASASRTSHAVTRLEQLGWVRRVPSSHDRRSLLAELTDEGRRTLAAAAPGHAEEVLHTVFDPLSAEQTAQLEAIARDILTSMTASSSLDGRGSARGDDLAIPPAPDAPAVGAIARPDEHVA
ncbi:Transcriptional repressor MprA [Clavibacter michiganensis]|uniref:Transcriptional repressor MprA n=1 Tax=Clavibacter michiganensis TaxID=28447 RepID=A0A251YC55_9MICO|nr:MarR family transcriptional regulator [Clavibacter michiganensis]OUE21825.1 Transcriptional repressor MprA [Clavibacter michiganensis]